jgi:hypothetical protein
VNSSYPVPIRSSGLWNPKPVKIIFIPSCVISHMYRCRPEVSFILLKIMQNPYGKFNTVMNGSQMDGYRDGNGPAL